MKRDLNIKTLDTEELSLKTKRALIEIICRNDNDGKPIKLPNEDELAQQLGVSRNVLRDALMSLEELGIVTRRRSKGTLANPALAKETGRMDANPELVSMLQEAGHTVNTETLRLGFVFENDPAFGPGQDSYLNVEKLFTSGEGVPLCFCVDHFSGKYAKAASDAILELKNLSHYAFLEKYCNTAMAYSLAKVDAVVPDAQLRELMKLEEHEPLLMIDDGVYNYDHEIVIHSLVYYRHGCLDLKFLRKCW